MEYLMQYSGCHLLAVAISFCLDLQHALLPLQGWKQGFFRPVDLCFVQKWRTEIAAMNCHKCV